MTEAWTPVCEVCHGRPKMDRSVCCEECWYSGRYARWFDEKAWFDEQARTLGPLWLRYARPDGRPDGAL